MSIPARFASSFAFLAFFLVAVSALLFAPSSAAYAEAVRITGAQLLLLHGSPEDMMRYPLSDPPLRGYPTPRTGDIVQLQDDAQGFTISCYWPKIVIVWEDCGARAEFDYRDHRAYLNGKVFAVVLTSSGAWQWLAGASEEEVAGIRYCEIGGVPPANFATILARLPKHRMAVRCDAGCFQSLSDAISPLDPIALLFSWTDQKETTDFRAFKSCIFLKTIDFPTPEVFLPPNLKFLYLESSGFATKVHGAEGSLEAVWMECGFDKADWLTAYGALKDFSVPDKFTGDDDFQSFASLIVRLPKLRSLEFQPENRRIPFISDLGKLKYLSLPNSNWNVTPLAELVDLEYLRLDQLSKVDVETLSALKNLKFLDLTIKDSGNFEEDHNASLDLADLEPIAAKITCLRVTNEIPIKHPEIFAKFTCLDILTCSGNRHQTLSAESLSSLKTLRVISGLCFDSPDISPLAKLPLLETLEISSYEEIDLSGLKGCSSLRWLWVNSRGKLDISPLASLPALEWLSLYTTTDCSENFGLDEDAGCVALSKLKGLRGLILQIEGLRAIGCLRSLGSLVALRIGRYQGEDLGALADIASLRYFTLDSCRSTLSGALILPRNLRSLYISNCGMLTDLSFPKGAEGLITLEIWGCPVLMRLPKTPGPLASLVSLYVAECPLVRDSAGLASMPALEDLTISGFSGKELAGFETLKSLVSVTVSEAATLQHIPKLAPGAPISFASFSETEALQTLEGIETWTELRSLGITLGKEITDLSPLLLLKKLTCIGLAGGDSVTDVSPLEQMTSLKYFTMNCCKFATQENIDALKKALPGCRISAEE